MLLHRVSGWGYSALVVALLAAFTANASASPILGFSQLGGWVYIDRNNDGQLAFLGDLNPEFVIAGVSVNLYANNGGVETFVESATSDDNGRYLFENIAPGTYDLKETQPIEYVDGKDTLGSLQSFVSAPVPPTDSVGTASNDAFFKIVLSANVGGDFFNFGELGLKAGYASKRYLFASAPPLNTPTPEPASLLIALMGGFGVCCARRARAAKK